MLSLDHHQVPFCQAAQNFRHFPVGQAQGNPFLAGQALLNNVHVMLVPLPQNRPAGDDQVALAGRLHQLYFGKESGLKVSLLILQGRLHQKKAKKARPGIGGRGNGRHNPAEFPPGQGKEADHHLIPRGDFID